MRFATYQTNRSITGNIAGTFRASRHHRDSSLTCTTGPLLEGEEEATKGEVGGEDMRERREERRVARDLDCSSMYACSICIPVIPISPTKEDPNS